MRKIAVLTIAFAASLSVGEVLGQAAGDALAKGFRDPPDSAKPRTWWHWTLGNVT